MGLLTIIQIPCHHVLANENALNLKYRIGLKQFFNINLGIGIIKKTKFFFSYFRHISLYFYSNFDQERIQRVPTWHTFDGPRYPKNKKCLKKRDDASRFSGISCFWGSEVRQKYAEWYSMDAEFNSTSNKLSRSKFE